MLGTVEERVKVNLRRRSNLISAKIDEGLGFETHLTVFPALNQKMDLLGLHLKAKSNLKFQVL